MNKRNKLLSKVGFYYYNLLAFITKGNKRFVDKKLLFGALIIGLSSQYACKTKNQDNNILSKDKDTIRDESTLCYKSIEKTDTSNTKTKNQHTRFYKNNISDTIIRKDIQEFELIDNIMCYLISKEPIRKPVPQIEITKLQKTIIEDTSSVILCYAVTESEPEFPGGEEKRIQFLRDNLNYPQIARDNNIQGTVYVTFVVTKDGKISDVKVLRGISKECDEEAVRVIKLMPKWKPGEQMGKPVNVLFNMPIKFSLDKQ